jgi:hypothetical protein
MFFKNIDKQSFMLFIIKKTGKISVTGPAGREPDAAGQLREEIVSFF